MRLRANINHIALCGVLICARSPSPVEAERQGDSNIVLACLSVFRSSQSRSCVMSSPAFPIQPDSPRRHFDDDPREEPLLTWRQVQVLKWVQEGKSSWEIGAIIGISGRTVEGHLRKIYARLDAHTRLDAVLRAHELGLIPRRTMRS
ncbi:MAG: hypothetical protein DI570_02745 [Phenylobacterium zucineum]|nr:MAG: hypothetical protein DI570_02745 [Phenylobacterium zucineum]